MRVILDINDDVLADMQMHSDIVQKDLNIMLSELFINYVSEPGEVIKKEVEKDDCQEFEGFQTWMFNYITTIAYDSKHISMHKVLIRMRELMTDMHIMTDLYKTYKATR